MQENVAIQNQISTKKEEIIFDESNLDRPQDSVDALRQLNKQVIIDLVFDGDMKMIKQSQEQRASAKALEKLEVGDQEMDENEDDLDLPETVVKKTKSVALPFASLGGRAGQKPQEEEKSKVY